MLRAEKAVSIQMLNVLTAVCVPVLIVTSVHVYVE